MPPLGSIFRSGTSKPKIDHHSLFTSIQVSVPVLQGTLQIYEPWKKKRVKAKSCHVTLYANDTSPFLVWYKNCNPASGKSPTSPGSRSQSGPSNSATSDSTYGKPRCVLPVSRAKVTKTTGGCFEVVDFATSYLFRFVAPTVRESEKWVSKLKEESQREANLDMGSICSSCSSSSSHPSPVNGEYTGFFSSSPSTPTVYSSRSVHQSASSVADSFAWTPDIHSDEYEGDCRLFSETDVENWKARSHPDDLPLHGEVFCGNRSNAHVSSSNKTFPRTQVMKQRHTRAQPHLGINVATVDKHRPDLGSLLRSPSQRQGSVEDRTALPFSEYFVNLPDS